MSPSLINLAAVGLFLVLLTGCPEKQTPAEPLLDLGTADNPLLPVGSTMHDARLAKGAADWVPFRELEQGGDQGDDATAEGGEQPPSEDATETEQEIRGLLRDYNQLVADRDIEEIVVYHIESHQDTVKAWYEAQFAQMDKLGEIETALTTALPEEADRIAGVFAPLKRASGGLEVGKLTVENDSLVIGELTNGTTPVCKFTLADEEWFIEIPNLPETFAQLKPRLDAQISLVDNLKQGLESGQIAADQILTQLEAQVKALTDAGGATPPEEGVAADGEGDAADEQPAADDDTQSD